jgi:hypothetical protein
MHLLVASNLIDQAKNDSCVLSYWMSIMHILRADGVQQFEVPGFATNYHLMVF